MKLYLGGFSFAQLVFTIYFMPSRKISW